MKPTEEVKGLERSNFTVKERKAKNRERERVQSNTLSILQSSGEGSVVHDHYGLLQAVE